MSIPTTDAELLREGAIAQLEVLLGPGEDEARDTQLRTLAAMGLSGSAALSANAVSSAASPAAAAAAAGVIAGRLKAGRALLRLYGLYPGRTRRDLVLAVLAQALAAAPRADFQLALFLVPAPLRTDPAVLALEECEKLLQVRSTAALAGLCRSKSAFRSIALPRRKLTAPAPPPSLTLVHLSLGFPQIGRFAQMWTLTKDQSLAATLAAQPGFAEGVRAFMLSVLNRMYQRLELADLGAYLDLSPEAAGACARAAGWALDDGGRTAVAPLITDNQPRPKAQFDEGVKYADVQHLVATLART